MSYTQMLKFPWHTLPDINSIAPASRFYIVFIHRVIGLVCNGTTVYNIILYFPQVTQVGHQEILLEGVELLLAVVRGQGHLGRDNP